MRLGVLYLLPATLWVVVAQMLAPRVIQSAYQGQSLPLLNRVFQRQISHPLEHYLGLWQTFWQALLLAWFLHLAVVLVVRATENWIGAHRTPLEQRRARTIDRWLIGFALAFLMFTVLSGARHDYVAFVEIWDAVRAGGDPWWVHAKWGYPLNAYGPLFTLFALPAQGNALAPKLLFALSYCVFSVLFLKGGMASAGLDFPAFGLLAWLIGPFAWVEIAYFGHFDVLPAIACVAAVALVLQGREVLSGASLAVGFLLKLLPAVIVPFYALDGRRVRFRFLAGGLLPIALGYGVSYEIWGRAALRPFGFAHTRGSTLISIFRFLRGGASPLRRFVEHPNLDAWSTPCIVVAGLLVFLACWWRRTDPATSALLAILTSLLLYKVGFIQYQMILYLLMAFWLGRYGTTLPRRRGLAVSIGGYFGGLTLFDLFYCSVGGVIQGDGPWVWVEDLLGLPTFLLGSCLLVNLLRVSESVRS